MTLPVKATYHVIRTLPSSEMAGEHIPIIFVAPEDGYVLREAYSYFMDDRFTGYSGSWRAAAAKTIAMFFDFFKASEETDLNRAISRNKLVRNFLLALQNGTVLPDGSDLTSLRWKPCSAEVLSLRKGHLKTFLDALQDLVDGETVFPTRFTDVSLSSRAFEKKKNLSMLYHIYKSKSKAIPDRSGPRRSQSTRVGHKHKPFPPDLLVQLISEGCRLTKTNKDFYSVDGRPTLASEFNLNLLMALLLMAGAGLRKSEIFHLFVEDVSKDVVWIYDPERGVTENGRMRVNVLREDYGLLPRNKISGTQKAGFKGFLITDGTRNRSPLHFLPSYEKLFLQVFREYRRHLLPNTTDHPFLFVSTDVRYYGQPWSIDAFDDAFEKALHRIGVRQSKFDATTPHCLRHGYCQSLINMKLSPLLIQQCMHHTTLDAQRHYSHPGTQQINATLQKAAEVMTAERQSRTLLLAEMETPDLLGGKYKSDPAGLFAPHVLGADNDRI